MERGPRSRFWCFTENDNPDTFIPMIELEGLPDGVTYLCGQLEVTSHLHLQGYLELAVQNRISWLKKRISPTAHFEKRLGNQEEAIHYCSKPHDGCDCKNCADERLKPSAVPGSFFELGERSVDRQGKRNDILSAQALIKEGADDLTVADKCFRSWCQYSRSFEVYRNKLIIAGRLEAPGTRGPVTTTVLWGPPGSGKTTLSRLMAGVSPQGGPDLFEKAPQSPWWTGYDGQRMVLLDEHNSGWLTWDTFMALLNPIGGPLSVPIHGGMVTILATQIYITCNEPPENWYKNISAHKLPALWRRLATGGVHKVAEDHTVTVLPDYSPEPIRDYQPHYRYN